ncbi:ATP-binding protein [Salmonella enterica]|uniref:ATP-binding protein n=1 Tax=Salmonella enterica TaxID=28901 RepID=A0A5U0QPP5_SALER|nr:ATP-binding protein [Salmonella enterica]EBY2762370.1 ATP-binding protein [Salmonella enterica subsp. enterica serovar Gaminara]EEJ7181198.1 ATP-binding protein [Salmonella enterica subsp. enterica serovar Glostrup]HAU3311646.1 ATP-binding protein [Salmonella enterica subsp. houtenae]EBT1698047.1 ATP-binding protein [Salmonella enterica]
MYKQAINLLKNLDRHILTTGATGTGKSTLLTELRIDDNDSKYYHFPEINSGKQNWALCDENFNDFDFLAVPEKTLILDGVHIPENLNDSKVVQFIKTARKHGKRLIVVTFPSEGDRIKSLFGAVITLSGGVNSERACEVEILS